MFDEGRYDADQLRRHRVTICALVATAVLICVAVAALTSWPWRNAAGMSAVAVAFGAALWWAFASRKAGPLEVNKQSWTRFRRTFFMKTD